MRRTGRSFRWAGGVPVAAVVVAGAVLPLLSRGNAKPDDTAVCEIVAEAVSAYSQDDIYNTPIDFSAADTDSFLIRGNVDLSRCELGCYPQFDLPKTPERTSPSVGTTSTWDSETPACPEGNAAE